MMIRVRKYRIFILVAAVSLTIVWYISQDASWSERPSLSGFTGLRGYGQLIPDPTSAQDAPSDSKDDSRPGSKDKDPLEPPAEVVHPNAAPAVPTSTTLSTSSIFTASSSSTSVDAGQPTTTEPPTATSVEDKEIPEPYRKHVYDDDDTPTNTEPIRYIWTKSAERYPVPSASLIQLPTGAPKTIPRIQYAFEPDIPTVQNELFVCRDTVRKAMKRTWDGYKKFAWLKDELRPVEGGYKDKFMGWAATLVDSLDTLWIMDLHLEFEEAVNATATIDFKQSTDNRMLCAQADTDIQR